LAGVVNFSVILLLLMSDSVGRWPYWLYWLSRYLLFEKITGSQRKIDRYGKGKVNVDLYSTLS